MNAARWILPLLLSTAVAEGAPRTVERVVATVDGQPIWLSDIRGATVILRKQLKDVPAAKREAARRDIFEQLVDRASERKLIEREARSLQVSVSTGEVDRALALVAKQNAQSVEQLLVFVQKEGMSEAAYRRELRYQLLEAKLLQLRMMRAAPSERGGSVEARLEAERSRWLGELRKRSHIVLRVRP